MDETYITAGEKGSKNLSRSPRKHGGTRRRERGSLEEGKVPVMVVTERGGKTILFVAPEGLSKSPILPFLSYWTDGLRKAPQRTQTTSQSTPTR